MSDIKTDQDLKTAEAGNPLECLVIRDLLINVDNHEKYNSVEHHWQPEWADAMTAFNDVNVVLGELLGSPNDWGGRYATFLGDFGFDWQTENGWWGLPAIDKENIKAFVLAEQDEDFLIKCQKAQLFIERTGAQFDKQNVFEIVAALDA